MSNMKIEHFFTVNPSDIYNYEPQENEKFSIGISYDNEEFDEAFIELKSSAFDIEKLKQNQLFHGLTMINKNEIIKLRDTLDLIINDLRFNND